MGLTGHQSLLLALESLVWTQTRTAFSRSGALPHTDENRTQGQQPRPHQRRQSLNDDDVIDI